MQLAIKIAKMPMYFAGWCVLMVVMGLGTFGVIYGAGWLVHTILYALAVTQ
jgi:hypothetical protein